MLESIKNYIEQNIGSVLLSIQQHLEISFLALLSSIIIGCTIGYLVYKHPKHSKLLVSFFETLKIIPNLALLFILIPLIGVGVLPSVVALVTIGVMPILLNTITGFQSSDPFLIEVSQAMGMSEKQIVKRVRIPQAFPFIFTGIQTAFIEIVASTTIAAYIGAGGLGSIIITGLNLARTDMLIVGGVSVAILSLLAGLSIQVIRRIILKYEYL
ncbi:MAG: ABC transporter permease [Erysipelothrix sp.]|nr:ABC transporter permease [Erysipelothrix sp.]